MKDILRVIKTTRNWYSIIPVMMRLQKQTELKFKNGLRFYYANGLFSVEHFLEQPYARANTRGRDVVDVGAFVGDSTIYFAWKGARRVFAFEPIPASYVMALANIHLNGIQNVEMFNEAVGVSEGKLTIDEDMAGDRSFSLPGLVNQSSEGKSIRIRSFETLVKDFNLEDAVLKMDCEGCEYGILLSVRDEFLLPFTQIILEYHHGPDQLVERLSKSGYSTEFLDIRGRPLQEAARGLGLLYASRLEAR